MKKSKRVRSIHFVGDKVIVDYGEHKTFQFCKDCKNGNHLKNFLNFFYPNVNLQAFDVDLAMRMERRFYFMLWRGRVHYIFNHEADAFSEYLQERCERVLARREKLKRRAS